MTFLTALVCLSKSFFCEKRRWPQIWAQKGSNKHILSLRASEKITYASENPTVEKVTSGKKNGKEERNRNGKV